MGMQYPALLDIDSFILTPWSTGLADKALHYLRVKGFAALLLIPSVPHLQIANKLLLCAPHLPLRAAQGWRVSLCMTPGTVGPCLGSHLFPALPSCAF